MPLNGLFGHLSTWALIALAWAGCSVVVAGLLLAAQRWCPVDPDDDEGREGK